MGYTIEREAVLRATCDWCGGKGVFCDDDGHDPACFAKAREEGWVLSEKCEHGCFCPKCWDSVCEWVEGFEQAAETAVNETDCTTSSSGMCPACGGSGTVDSTARYGFRGEDIWLKAESTCSRCRGSGKL
jgi:DnaJ-class molecular chaperone